MTKDELWIRNLKAGDKVIVYNWNSYGSFYREETVDKITPAGFVKIGTTLYTPETGRERGSGHSRILNPELEETKEAVERQEREFYVKGVAIRMRNIKSLTYEQAKKIDEILSQGENEK